MTETAIQNHIIHELDRNDQVARIVNVVHRPGGGMNVAIRNARNFGMDLLIEGNGRVEVATVHFTATESVDGDGFSIFDIVSINGRPSIRIVTNVDDLMDIMFEMANVEEWNDSIAIDAFGC